MLLEAALWLVAVYACAFALLPATLRFFSLLPDRGYGLAKPIGLLASSYLLWVLGMLGYLRFERATSWIVVLGVALGTWRLWGEQAKLWLQSNRKLVLLEELIFAAAFVLALLVRVYNPDIIGQEKFMDLAFFNSFLNGRQLPAEDPWLAGYGAPYYPFGYLMYGLPAKMSGLAASYAYNLAMVLVVALTFAAVASLVSSIVALLRGHLEFESEPDRVPWLFGLIGGCLVAVCGNLVGPLEVLAARNVGGPDFWRIIGIKNLQAPAAAGGWLPADGGWWWHASRVIPTIQPDGITEFPFFSFLLGDLHPHFMTLPLLVLVSAVTLTLLLARGPWRSWETLLLAGLVLGAPLAANTWDTATAWAMYGIAALVSSRTSVVDERERLKLTLQTLAPLALGVLLFSPYFVGYASQPLGIGIVNDKTPLSSFLIIFGPLLALAVLGSIGSGLSPQLKDAAPSFRSLSAFCGLLIIVALVTRHPMLVVALALCGLSLAVSTRLIERWKRQKDVSVAAALFVVGIVGLSLAIVICAEVLFLRDTFGTRMNTVFKFYYHVWLLLGLAGAPAVALWLCRTRFGDPSRIRRIVGGGTLAGVLVLGLVYPVAATWTKSNGFAGVPTLDGAAFLQRSRPGDAAAVRWLAQLKGRPVVLEAVGGDYQEFARVSTFSGLPTVLGWPGHELQWRGQLEEYGHRQQDVETLYRRADREGGQRILDRYRVSYVFFGSLEQERYGRQTEERLAAWLKPVFREQGTTVFAVERAGQDA